MTSVLCVALNPTVDVSCEAARVRPTHKIRTHNQRHHPGGGGVNVARVIAELGGNPELLYLSGGATGALLDDLLASAAIEKHKIATSVPVRMAFMVYEEETGLEYRFVPVGSETGTDELQLAFEAIERSRAAYVVASGSLPSGVPDDTYRKMADLVSRRGGRFVLDANGPALAAALAGGNIFLLKPSMGELELIAGHQLDAATAGAFALDLVEKSVARYVAVTMGGDGALLAGDSIVRRLPAHQAKVRSTVGAGDSFLGAMVWSLAAGETVDRAFRVGLAAGTAAVLTPGTELCRRHDVEAILAGSAEDKSAAEEGGRRPQTASVIG